MCYMEVLLIRIMRSWAVRILALVFVTVHFSQFIVDAAELRETAYMKLGRHAAPWVTRFVEVLKANWPPRWFADEFAVFKGVQGQEYLAVLWRGQEGVIRTPILEFHKLIHDSEGGTKLKFLREFGRSVRSVALEPPSGERIFPGEAPVAVVDVWGGGLHPTNFGKRLIQLKQNTVDITPPIRVEKVVDIDGDGVYEVVVADDRWLGYFDMRSGAGPSLQMVLKRENENFHLACRRYAEFYKKRIVAVLDHRWITEFVAAMPEPERTARRNAVQAEEMANALLSFVQIGLFDEARKIYRKIEAHYDGNKVVNGPPAKIVLRDFGEVLAQAETLGHTACPVLAVKSQGGHYGLVGRAESFRMKSTHPHQGK